MIEPAHSATEYDSPTPRPEWSRPSQTEVVTALHTSASSDVPDLAEEEIFALTDAQIRALEPSEFAFPGPLRDELVAAILSGAKTATSSLECEYLHDDEPLPRAGTVQRLIDSDSRAVAVIAITEVRVITLADVDLAHARDEGEGFQTVEQWRRGHEGYWHCADYRSYLGDPDFTVSDGTRMIAERFRVMRRLDPPLP